MIGTRFCGTNESIVRPMSIYPPNTATDFIAFDLGRILPAHLTQILTEAVAKNVAAYEPPKQARSVLLYWRLPEEWAEALHAWVRCAVCTDLPCAYNLVKATSTGQLNTILTFYDITDPPIESELSGIPVPLLRKAINILTKSGRAQLIGVADGEGVRLFSGGR